MPANPVRYGLSNPNEPSLHDLPPVRYGAALIAVQVEVRRAEDGTWRGRLMFFPPDAETPTTTGEILCGTSESELWESVRDLRDHHLRDLYRSLAP
ncbi:MAG: hypothetical protein HYT81_01205 [Gemmatimonadetes bacterium]|nr:hypothetical protein [Gemmatimonadota bacterium]